MGSIDLKFKELSINNTNFRQINLIPTQQEILSTEPSLIYPNRKTGSYKNGEDYLNVQFRLLREDCLRLFKDGIQDFIKNKSDYLEGKKKKMDRVRIYPSVKICDITIGTKCINYWFQMPYKTYSAINWEDSKCLLPGSLLLFTSDNFATCYFAVAANTYFEKLQRGIFMISWEGSPPPFDTLDNDFVMIENEVYFEAYRHNLKALQMIDMNEFPIARYIVKASRDVIPPKYLRINSGKMIQLEEDSVPINLFVEESWPCKEELGLDASQYIAFKSALTKEFAIIQGPPGTGKTYLGLKIVEVMLRNQHAWRGDWKNDGVILVVCYTNHALDQFLEGTLSVFEKLNLRPSIARVGGNCNAKDLQNFILHNQRLYPENKRCYSSISKTRVNKQIEEILDKRDLLLGDYSALDNLEGIVDFSTMVVWPDLKNEFSSYVWNHLKSPSWFGFKNEEFYNNHFSADELMKNWFKNKIIKFQPLSLRLKSEFKLKPEARKGKGKGFKSRRFTFSGDRKFNDLDQRVVDDNEEDDTKDDHFLSLFDQSKDKENIKSFLLYANCLSVQGAKNLVKYYETKLATINKSMINTQLKGDPLTETLKERATLKKELIKETNKKRFFKKLFAKFNQNKVRLPNLQEIQDILSLCSDENDLLGKGKRNFNTLCAEAKFAVYLTVLERAKKFTRNKIIDLNTSLSDAFKRLEQVKMMGDVKVLKKSVIIGMTTTGAAKYHEILNAINCKIVIVEEAAKVVEAHVVTSITKSCQHLILLGDHQQLRPITAVRELSFHYHLDISLFERMVNNNLNCYRLGVQHRMRPEIANLITGTIYKGLKNGENVLKYPKVLGISKNIFFINHKEMESNASDSSSKCNEHEADFLISLSKYFLAQGYEPSSISILTTYKGQMFMLENKLRDYKDLEGVRVNTSDGFQGKENDIILLSMVRCNENGSIGFLKDDRRICVALSRAKHGLYICGNMEILAKNSKTWNQIEKKLIERGEIGSKLTLKCQIHSCEFEVSSKSDFKKVPVAGWCNPNCKEVTSFE